MNAEPAANDDGYLVTDPKLVYVAEKMKAMTPWMQTQFLRFVLRLRNNDPKLQRQIELRDKGFISHEEFWRRM